MSILKRLTVGAIAAATALVARALVTKRPKPATTKKRRKPRKRASPARSHAAS
jgi:hypothetical protein